MAMPPETLGNEPSADDVVVVDRRNAGQFRIEPDHRAEGGELLQFGEVRKTAVTADDRTDDIAVLPLGTLLQDRVKITNRIDL